MLYIVKINSIGTWVHIIEMMCNHVFEKYSDIERNSDVKKIKVQALTYLSVFILIRCFE